MFYICWVNLYATAYLVALASHYLNPLARFYLFGKHTNNVGRREQRLQLGRAGFHLLVGGEKAPEGVDKLLEIAALGPMVE